MFQFIPKVLNGVVVRALCTPVKFLHIKLESYFFFLFLIEVGGHHTVETRKDISGKFEVHLHLKYYIHK